MIEPASALLAIAVVTFVVITALVAVAGFGVLVFFAWRALTRRVAEPYVAAERNRMRARLKMQRQQSRQREEAMLAGATTVADALVKRVMDGCLEHCLMRESQHRQELIRMLRLLNVDGTRFETIESRGSAGLVHESEDVEDAEEGAKKESWNAFAPLRGFFGRPRAIRK